MLHHALPDAQLVSFDVSSALALFKPMEINIEIKVPNAAPKTGDYRLLRSVVTSGALGLVENVMPQLLGAMPNRKYGLDAHVTFQYDQDETITLPADTKVVALPNDAKAASKVVEPDRVVHEGRCDDGEVSPLVPAEEPVHRSRPVQGAARRARLDGPGRAPAGDPRGR